METATDAIAMAQIIAADQGHCLNEGGNHSMACGDDVNCAEERLKRAQCAVWH